MKNKKFLVFLTSLLLLCSFTLTGCGEVANLGSDLSELGSIIEDVGSALDELDSALDSGSSQNSESTTPEISGPVSLDSIPAFSGEPYVVINNNEPFFKESEINTTVFEDYAELDNLGRCGVAYANICKELMPTDDRESISNVKPSGWINKPYDFVDGRYLYNRCHLIGFQLAGENANKLNLITGTRYMNVQGMLPFENMIDDYVDETNNHVLYRVTPIYTGNNLVADGVLMEAYSVEDDGDGICFNIFCYNVQPGVKIDYATGDNWLDGEGVENTDSEKGKAETYVLNTKSKKFHKESCSGISKITKENKEEVKTTKEDLINKGYDPCGTCKP
jgi:DNA-entry nuclease